jgi:galactokinase
MNASQASCSELYECSCPELDTLTQLCRTSGAYGSRLTGAGWGGCTISLVAEDRVGEFVRKLKEGYEPYRELDEAELGEVIFATRPSNGAFGIPVITFFNKSLTDIFDSLQDGAVMEVDGNVEGSAK